MITIALLAFSEIRHLNSTVEVGFVEGMMAATVPTGWAISQTCFALSLRMIPTVCMSFIAE